jgi:transportin-3
LILKDQDRSLLLALKVNILNLSSAYKIAEANKDSEKCGDFCLIFTELCNALSFYLLNEPNTELGDLNCINMLLICSQNEDYEVFQKSFLFWFNISEEIYNNSNSEKLCLLYRSFIYTLIDCVWKHCCLDEGHVCIPPARSDDFGEFRLKASDLIADVVFMVDSNVSFEKMCLILQAPNASWFEIESALFVMCSLVKSISRDEEASVTQVVQAIVSLPDQVHVSVRCTGIQLIGELSEWINKHPQFINSALNFICTGFLYPKLCQVAANSMLNISTECQQHMTNHLETLVNIVTSTDTTNIPNEAYLVLIKCAVVVLCNLPIDRMEEPLMKLCKLQLDGLQQALNSTVDRATSKVSLLNWLDRFTAIFRTVKIKNLPSSVHHPCQSIVESIWPTFAATLNKYPKDSKIAESCCRALRFTLRCVEKDSRKILPDIVNSIVNMYIINHYSCFLYLGSILVDIFGSIEDDLNVKSGLIEMMQAFTNEAFNFIIKRCTSVENINELRKYSDTIDDFFRLSLRFLQRCPLEFLQSPIFNPVMTLAVTCLNLEHRDAHLSVTKFLTEFISISHKTQVRGLNDSNKDFVDRILNEIGKKMLENIINATINMTTRETKDGIADVVCELIFANRNVSRNFRIKF